MHETAGIWFFCVVLYARCLPVSSVLSRSSQRKCCVVLLCVLLKCFSWLQHICHWGLLCVVKVLTGNCIIQTIS